MPIQTSLQYKIRLLKRQEIEQLLQLCKAEGRQMGTVAEIESWMQIDPNGFYVAVTEKDQKIIGSCCGMCLSKTHGYVGMYVVHKEYRGLGIGQQIWAAAIAHLGNRNQGLSAVSHLFTLYRDKAGFSHIADWTVDLYRLDYMEQMILIHCNKHTQTFKRRKYERKSQKLLLPTIIGGADDNTVITDIKHLNNINNHQSILNNNENFSNYDGNRRRYHYDIANNTNELISTSLTTKECVFCCLGHQYKSKERKYLRQKRAMISLENSRSNIEFSDDETYGFSSLFFSDDENSENKQITNGDVIGENSLPNATTTDVTSSAVSKLSNRKSSSLHDYNDFNFNDSSTHKESLEFLFKFRFCKCIRCHGGKMRTIILNAQDEPLLANVIEYDRQLHQYDRSKIVRLTLMEKNCISRIAMLGQSVVGYGCVKPSLQNMWIMCPLYSDNDYVARMLMIDLISDLILISQSTLQLDKNQINNNNNNDNGNSQIIKPSLVLKTPSNNHNASRLLNELGFIKQDYSLKRCYTQYVMKVPTQYIYALHTSVFCTE